MRRKGFTLVELLVVIAIIVILAGILYPVFAAARRTATNAVCLSNVKQVGLAVQMYAQDYDETFPVAQGMFEQEIEKQGWVKADWPKDKVPTLWTIVKPYIKNDGLWRCPGDIGVTISRLKIDYRPNAYARVGSSYDYNTDLAWFHTKPTEEDPFHLQGYWLPLTVGAIQKPSDTMVAVEPAGHWHNGIKGTSDTYHQNGVCVDGHAKTATRGYANDVWGRDRSEY